MYKYVVMTNWLASEDASTHGLELNNDVGELHVALLLEMCEHTGAEKELALTHSVQVLVQLQVFYLQLTK